MRYSMGSVVDHKSGAIRVDLFDKSSSVFDDAGGMDVVRAVASWQVATFDHLVRNALIELGWTPPPEKT